MKKTILTLGLVLGLIMLIVPVYGAPRLTIPEAEFNFGYVPQNAKISHVFWLKSTGDDSLRILSVKPG